MYIVDFDITKDYFSYSKYKLVALVQCNYSNSIHHKTHSFQKVVLVGIRGKNL